MSDLLVVGTSDGEVVGLDRDTGAKRFVTRLATKAAYQPVRVGNAIVVGGDRGLWALDGSTGAPQVQLLVPFGARSSLEVAGRRIFFVGGGGTVNAVDLLPK
jgi:outer membrane protein assembly factor BamB